MVTLIASIGGILIAVIAGIACLMCRRSYRNHRTALEQHIAQLTEQLTLSENTIEQYEVRIQELSTELAAADRQLCEQRTAIQKSAAELARQKTTIQETTAALKAQRDSTQEISAAFDAEKIRVKEATAALAVAQERIQKITAALNSTESLLTVAKRDLANEHQKVIDRNKEISRLKHSLTDYQHRLEQTEKRLKDEQEFVHKKMVELEHCREQLSVAERTIEHLDEKRSFVAAVINAQPKKNTALDEYTQLLENDYQIYANKNDSLAEEALAMKYLLEIQAQLKLITHDAQLLGKTIVAVGGASSSGKSSFLNSFFVQDTVTLPVGMDPTTAIASYVMHDQNTQIIGYTYNGGKVGIPPPIFSLFSYGKEGEFKFNMKRIIDQIVFKTEFVQPFEHICFIDTPGFNPGSNSQLDYNTAITAIANAQALLWCFDITSGTIPSSDLSILQDIIDKNPKIKIYIIANRSDQKPPEEQEDILTTAELELESNFIQYEGISLYTSCEKYTTQPAEYAESTRKIPLTQFLESCNIPNMQKERALISQVQNIFAGYIEADKARISKIERQINTFNTIESSFVQIVDQKDEIIAYYKARQNIKGTSPRSSLFKADTAPIDDDEAFDKLTDSIAEIKTDLQKQLQSDKADIAAAKDLSKKFCTCIRHIFKTGGTQAAE